MYVQIRPESAQNEQLLNMLKYTTANMINKLNNNGITLHDNDVKIWIKQYSKSQLFPKIEFDSVGQELQYDMTHDGMIRETHFKSFIHDSKTGKTKRHDIPKEQANQILQQIDTIIRFSNNGFTNEE